MKLWICKNAFTEWYAVSGHKSLELVRRFSKQRVGRECHEFFSLFTQEPIHVRGQHKVFCRSWSLLPGIIAAEVVHAVPFIRYLGYGMVDECADCLSMGKFFTAVSECVNLKYHGHSA